MNKQLMLGLCAAAAMLSACGGGGGDDHSPPPAPAPLTEVPASAGASAEAYTAFGVSQAAATSESDEPLGTDQIITAPVNDTAEPVAL